MQQLFDLAFGQPKSDLLLRQREELADFRQVQHANHDLTGNIAHTGSSPLSSRSRFLQNTVASGREPDLPHSPPDAHSGFHVARGRLSTNQAQFLFAMRQSHRGRLSFACRQKEAPQGGFMSKGGTPDWAILIRRCAPSRYRHRSRERAQCDLLVGEWTNFLTIDG
jgi:hypothetical protein